MREILFRGKRLDNSEWIYGSLIQHDISIICSADEQREVDPATVGQYTGLTDENGKKIFEGDILRWDEKAFGMPFNEEVKWDFDLFGLRKDDWQEFCEVIGNIWDNPELLKEEARHD